MEYAGANQGAQAKSKTQEAIQEGNLIPRQQEKDMYLRRIFPKG